MEPKLLTVQQIIAGGAYPFTLGQIRHYLTHRHKNGLDKAIVKIGKRVYFKISEFDEWIENQSHTIA